MFLRLILCVVFARAVFDRAQLQAVPPAAKSVVIFAFRGSDLYFLLRVTQPIPP